jgi:hypothetical protein
MEVIKLVHFDYHRLDTLQPDVLPKNIKYHLLVLKQHNASASLTTTG